MRKWLITAAMLPVLLLTACSSAHADEQRVGDALSLDLPEAASISYEDTHGGFHGDGETFAVLTFDEDAAQEVETLLRDAGWQALPMEGDLAIFAYGGEKEGVSYGYEALVKNEVPVLENGWYWFFNRDDAAENPYSADGLLGQGSINCTVSAYDADTDTLYFYELDT